MAGDLIAVELPAGVLRRPMRAEEGALCVLHEDDHLLALDKPAGVVVHPTHAHTEGTLMNALLWHARLWPEPQRPSLVGRLDKLTSGVVLVAKSAAMHAALQRAMTDAACEKDYLAVVYGRVSPPQGEIRLRLGRDRSDRRKIAASASAGVPCLTRFERLARATLPDAGASLLRCRLVTGRTHQIRVHLSAQGWPIIGDPDYGEPRWSAVADSGVAAALRAFPRQALHAWRLSLVHPVSGARLLIEAPLPEDFRELLALLRLARPSPSCERAVGACENPLARVFQQSTCDSALTG
jgi:23S rRNA pseudouridine1911/1915/1917 synthase